MDSAVSDDAADSWRSVLFHCFLLPAEPAVHPTMVVADDSSLYDRARVVPSGSMPIVVQLDAVSDQGGNHYYSHTTTNLEGVVADMKAIQLECSNPSAFQDKITVQVDDGEVTLSCNKIVDTSDVSIVCIIAAEISSDQEGE